MSERRGQRTLLQPTMTACDEPDHPGTARIPPVGATQPARSRLFKELIIFASALATAAWALFLLWLATKMIIYRHDGVKERKSGWPIVLAPQSHRDHLYVC
jgi:hypothetical protein